MLEDTTRPRLARPPRTAPPSTGGSHAGCGADGMARNQGPLQRQARAEGGAWPMRSQQPAARPIRRQVRWLWLLLWPVELRAAAGGMARPGPGSRANAHRAITAASGKVEHLVHQSPTTQTRIIILPPLVRGEVSARRPSRWSPRDGDSAFEGQMAHAAEGATQVEVRTQQPGTCRAAATRSDRARPGGPSHGIHLRPRPGVLDGLQPAAATRRFPLSPRLLRRVRCERPLRPGLRMRRACTLA